MFNWQFWKWHQDKSKQRINIVSYNCPQKLITSIYQITGALKKSEIRVFRKLTILNKIYCLNSYFITQTWKQDPTSNLRPILLLLNIYICIYILLL